MAGLKALVDRINGEMNVDPPAALALCNEALAQPQWREDAVAQVQLLLCRVRVLRVMGRGEDSRDCMTIALSAARSVQHPALLGEALTLGALGRLEDGEFVGASELAEHALEVGLEHGNAGAITRALSLVGVLSSWLGWHEQALSVNDVAQLAVARADGLKPIGFVFAERCMCLVSRLLDERQDERYTEIAATCADFQATLVLAQHYLGAAGQAMGVRALDHVNRLVRWIRAEHTGDGAALDALAAELDAQPPVEPALFNEFRRLTTALACFRDGRLSEAVACLNQGIKDIAHEQSPVKVTLLRTLADVHAAAGEWQSAHAAQQAFEAAQRARLDERSRRRVNALIERVQRDRAHVHAFVSHDLRSPLTAIIGATEVAVPRSHDDAHSTLERVAALADQALRYTDEYLRYAHLQSLGREQFEALCVADVVSAAVDEVGGLQKARRPQIVVRRERAGAADGSAIENPPAHIHVHSHRGTLHRIVVNLLANAVRASPKEAAVELELDVDDQRCLITVRDRGPGLPVDVLMLFVTGQLAPVRAGGTGLGSRYVLEATRALGGTLFAANDSGGGARVTVALPLA